MSVQVTRLPSGLSVVTDQMAHLETASLGVWIGSGSRNENPDEHGISHLLEHMAFKGTKRRTARQIAEAIEAVGGDLNAATSVESTGYFARVLKADVPLALDVLSDILSEPAFDAEELRREQNVIVQEIGATEDAPDDLVFDRLQETAFPMQPVGRSILGTPDTVRSFDATRLQAYLSRNYRAPGMVLAAAGAVEHDAVVAEAERRFAAFTGPAAPAPERAHFRGGTRVETRDLEQVHIAMALEGLPVRDEQLYSLQVFTSVLGGGMSSRLFQEVREIRGLCYAIHAFHMPYTDTGLFALYAGTDESDAPELMRVVIDQIGNATETLNDTEVRRAKAQMKAGLLMALESSEARVGQLARQMLAYGRAIPVDEIVAKVDAVTVKSARDAGQTLIGRAKPAIAALGPGSGLASTAAIAESLVRRAA
ncbi:MAG TPA: pitrilysin family protein [Pseudolabrys sp.]|jgi:predicted Zn-dependent peptidase|nr:pitrilysin family protein [Pseudolabrys sp.]